MAVEGAAEVEAPVITTSESFWDERGAPLPAPLSCLRERQLGAAVAYQRAPTAACHLRLH
jgi:hypothetical protein